MAAGGCDGWYFCHSDSTGAIVQELLQEGALARSHSKSLWAGADSGLYLPGLDSCPLPRASHSCPGVAPSTQKGRENPHLYPPRCSSRSATFPRAGNEDTELVCWKYWFVLQFCYWETKLCLRFNYRYLVWGLFVLNMDYYNVVMYALILVIQG